MLRNRQRTTASVIGSFMAAGMLVGCGSASTTGEAVVSSAGRSVATQNFSIDDPAKLRAAAEAAGYSCGEWAEGGVGVGELARGACERIGTWIVYPDHAAMLAGLRQYRAYWRSQGGGTETYLAVSNFLLVAGDHQRSVENVKGIAADLYDATPESFPRMD